MDDEFNEGFIARSPKEWVASMYLYAQSKVVEDLRLFLSSPLNSGDRVRYMRSLKGSLFSLFMLCSPRLSKSKKGGEDNKKKIMSLITSDIDEDVLSGIDLLFDYLENDLKLTDIASVQNYNRTNPFLSNKIKGFK